MFGENNNEKIEKKCCIVCGFMIYCIQNKRKGEQKMKLHYLLEKYHGLSYTSNYIMGRPVGGLVYAARLKGVDLATLVTVATLGKASSKNGGTLSVRFQPNLEQWAYITAHAVEIKVICTVEFLEKWAKEHGKNKGQAFEILTCEAWGGELESKPNAKFTEAGDMYINEEAYQAKYYKATFTDEKTLMNLEGRA